jgi:hypothetical protein
MTIKNICTKKTYQKNGEDKSFWPIVGTLKTTDDGKTFIELNMFPNTPFYVFDRKAKEPQKPVNSDADGVETVEL